MCNRLWESDLAQSAQEFLNLNIFSTNSYYVSLTVVMLKCINNFHLYVIQYKISLTKLGWRAHSKYMVLELCGT